MDDTITLFLSIPPQGHKNELLTERERFNSIRMQCALTC